MLTAIVIIYIILIFPLFIRFEGVLDTESKHLKYKIKLFKYITILFGYAEIINEGIAIHVNNIKAFIIYYKDAFTIRNKIKPLKDYHLYRLNSNISIGSVNNYDKVLSFSILYSAMVNCIGYSLKTIKPYVKLKNDIYVYKDKNAFNLKFDFVILLNILMIVLSFVKIILEKIIYAIKKQPN